jgi:hypothetical protein
MSAKTDPVPLAAPAPAVFHGTAAQWRLFNRIVRQSAPQPLAATLAAAHVSVSSYYRWLKQPGFAAWLSTAWRERQSAIPPGALLPLRELATLANHPRGARAAIGLLFSPYGLANLLPPAPPLDLGLAEPSNRRAPSPLSCLFRFHRALAGKGFASLCRLPRSAPLRTSHMLFQSDSRKKEH